jgi:hypothetical protein
MHLMRSCVVAFLVAVSAPLTRCAGPPTDDEARTELAAVPLPLPGRVDIDIAHALKERLVNPRVAVIERLDAEPVPGPTGAAWAPVSAGSPA